MRTLTFKEIRQECGYKTVASVRPSCWASWCAYENSQRDTTVDKLGRMLKHVGAKLNIEAPCEVFWEYPGPLSDTLLNIRRYAKVTRRQLVEASGLTHPALCHIEHGNRSPRLSTVMRYLGGLGYDPIITVDIPGGETVKFALTKQTKERLGK